jgi:hypothetical protein
MKLRTSKALKYFAILLFSFEMIAPVLMPADAILLRQDRNQKTYINTTHFASGLYSLVYEENSGEEEERESKDHKSNLFLTDFSFAKTFIALSITDDHNTSWVEQYEITASQPPLFTLFHTYII